MVPSRPTMPPLPVLRTIERFRSALMSVHRRTAPPPVALLDILVGGFLAQTLCAAAELGIADALVERPLTREELAARVGARPDALERLLSPLIGEGIFALRHGTYSLTPLAQPLRGDAEVSLRDGLRLFGDHRHRHAWSSLPAAVRTGEAAAEQAFGMPFFDYAAKDREYGELFDRAMSSFSEMSVEPILGAYDFSRFGTIVDVGGGHGLLLSEILRRAPQARGVLFDLPEVVESVPDRMAALGLADRCTVTPGSFFGTVPEGGNAYLLKHIIHDWSDEQAGRILSAVHDAMSDSARLLLIELVLPEDNRRNFGRLLDLEMLVNVGGHERTEQGYRDFLSANGFELVRRVETVALEDILEARPV
ncbi:methyltransferase [Nocardia sp. BMG51109]|uniref:methyltransferase n=1 Tax=Nocardia sp. BMG51109 TaxID=1056816 RepID=UPI000465A2E3|nr:methyltransferase [Nocardia sp. BMG51109]